VKVLAARERAAMLLGAALGDGPDPGGRLAGQPQVLETAALGAEVPAQHGRGRRSWVSRWNVSLSVAPPRS
jgi:hypothetical protein